MDNFLWWSGVIMWGALSLFGVLYTIDAFIEWLLRGLDFKRAFLEFAFERIKAKHERRSAPTPEAK